MSSRRLLRALILTDALSMAGSAIAAGLAEGSLPESLRTYASGEDVSLVFLIAALALFVLLIVSWVGLWRGASWAGGVYAATWAGCVALVPFGGIYITTGIEELFDFVGTSAGGGILALVLLAMKDPRAIDAGESTEPETAGGRAIDPPEAPMPAHLKSSRVHRILSWLYGFVALIMLGLPLEMWTREKEPRVDEMLIAFALPLFFLTLFLLHHFVSRGAKKGNRWARSGSIALACLMLPAVPLGTIIGVYLLRNSSWNSGSALASHAARMREDHAEARHLH
jgi:hypothetical protein